MRLLRFEDDRFRLVEYFGHTPPYAILSHTWGADYEEVTFKNIVENTGQGKLGYKKLQFCQKQAAHDDLQHFWVDTCCSDKSSSAELSEAINSMFQWYSNAAKCYVFLDDISVGLSDTVSIQDSRWFTRGWTLQELIAPKIVEFFSVDEFQLGNKQSLESTLHKITGITVQAIQGSPLSQFSIDERFSWAKGRQTKRDEDAAYSLLGIFDIQMPLIYGEGREKAFNRLRREIREASMDTKIALSPTSNVPFRRDPNFVNRGKILEEIHTKGAVPASCLALVGLGGVGKSQIAIEYSYRLRERSSATWVFWVYAGTRARFEEGYRRIAEITKLDGWNDPKANILQLVYSWLGDERNGNWLMVIDNADDATVFSRDGLRNHGDGLNHSIEPLSNFLPQSPNGSILVTSRSRDVAYRLTESHASVIEVKAMDEQDALILLEKKLGSASSRGNSESAELLRILDYMPLAITQAAAFIEQRAPRMTVSRYLDKFHKSDHNRARLLKTDVGDSRRDGQASNSIIKTWQISFEYVRKHKPTAAHLLSLMSLFDRRGIPESLLRSQYEQDKDKNAENEDNEDEDSEDGEADFEDDIHTLTSYSLIEMSADGKEFDMHRLVQFSTKKWLELYDDELEKLKEIYVKLMDGNYPEGLHENWSVCQALSPHAQAAVECRPADKQALEAWASVLFKAAWYASEMGHYSVARRLDQYALEAREALLGPNHADTLMSVNNLALVFQDQGEYEMAETMHRRALKAREDLFGADHSHTQLSLNNLAIVLRLQGKYEVSEQMSRRVLQGREIRLGKEHPDTFKAAGSLSMTLQKLGRYKEAEELILRVLRGFEDTLGKDHPATLTSVNNLGSILKDQGNYEEAEKVSRQALEGRERVLGKEHPKTLDCVSNLAELLQDQGKYEEAEAMYQRALKGKEKTLGKGHPLTLASMRNLVSMYRNQGRSKEA